MDRRSFLKSGTAASMTAGFVAGIPALMADAGQPVADPRQAAIVEGHALNAKAFGAVGDAKADDTDALQKAIDEAGYRKYPGSFDVGPGTVYLPAGHYRVTRTLKIEPRHRHVAIVGAGGASHYSPRLPGQGRAPAASTQIIWNGPEGDHLIDAWSVAGLEIRNIALFGQMADGHKAGVLLRVNSRRGFASSQFRLDKVSFLHAKKGLEFGGESYINSDCSTFIDCGFGHLDVGVHTMSEQNVGYLFLRPGFGWCKTAMWFQEGGIVDCITPLTHHIDTIIRIDRGGINAGTFRFTQLHAEQGSHTNRPRRYVVLQARGEATIEMQGLRTNVWGLFGPEADFETPAFDLSDGAHVLVTGSHINGRIAKLAGRERGTPTWITFQNCRFRCSEDPRAMACPGGTGYRLRDCAVTLDNTRGEKYQILESLFVPDLVRYPTQAKGQTVGPPADAQ